MALSHPLNPGAAVLPAQENHVVHTTFVTLKYIFGLVPIVAGADKFTNLLTNWEAYLSPWVLRIVPVNPTTFMHLVGVIEIVAGIIVFARPRIGAWIVMLWLLAIAGQLVLGGHYLDVAVRDIVMALAGALTLARIEPFAHTAEAATAS